MSPLDREVWSLLKGVSRSIYLSLKVLPPEVRDCMGLGYLLCRAADTIADTRLVPRRGRLEALDSFREAFASGSAPRLELPCDYARFQASRRERDLLGRLGACLGLWRRFPEPERRLLREVVFGVIEGMRMDLALFPGETQGEIEALPSPADLDRYCGLIGGEPGLFWTRLCLLRVRALSGADAAHLEEAGFRLGKGLQMTNILRDAAKDLRLGRCYIPGPELAQAGLSPAGLLDPGALPRLKPVLRRWLLWAKAELDAGAAFVEAMPSLRLRAAAAWPLVLSYRTLARVERSGGLLDPANPVKIPRGELRRLLAGSLWTLSSAGRAKRALARESAGLGAAMGAI
jgi:farnesyl-diphosphate farnesyltransferase